jgi:hypothetical protein
MFVTILASTSFAFGSLAIWSFINATGWSPQSYYWHYDVLWAVEYVSPPSLEEQRINDARAEAQSRYEAPIAGAFIASALVIFIASLGLMFRKNWARLLMITVVAVAVLEIALVIVLFWSLRMLEVPDYVAGLVTITILVVVALKLQSPAVISEFRHARA